MKRNLFYLLVLVLYVCVGYRAVFGWRRCAVRSSVIAKNEYYDVMTYDTESEKGRGDHEN